MRIAVLGPGRLGRSLHALLPPVGVHTTLYRNLEAVPATCDGLLLTVPDSAIASIRPLPAGLPVLHCSGATSVDVLRPHQPAGSFHPLMTFPGPEIALPDLTGVTAAIAGDEAAAQVGRVLAGRLGMRWIDVPGDRRLYHAAAVIAGNFATVLLAEAARTLAAAGVSAEEAAAALAPLARQSLANAVPDPSAALTGPVARGDEAVISAHQRALAHAGLGDIQMLYSALTDHARRLVQDSVAEDETQGSTLKPTE
jgi:predicted short-subunit dehydrogenase-like oxidoreductase (DUF2520 family)